MQTHPPAHKIFSQIVMCSAHGVYFNKPFMLLDCKLILLLVYSRNRLFKELKRRAAAESIPLNAIYLEEAARLIIVNYFKRKSLAAFVCA